MLMIKLQGGNMILRLPDSRYKPHKFIGDPIFSMETPIYSLETPIFSLESPRFSLEVLCIFIMTPLMRVSNENSGVSK